MKRLFAGFILASLCTGLVHADISSDFDSSGRYKMYTNPHANRVYVIDSQTGRLFQLIYYKEVNKEMMEEIPYIFDSNRTCSPADYQKNPASCFTRNYDYLKSLMDIKRQQKETAAPVPAPAPSAP